MTGKYSRLLLFGTMMTQWSWHLLATKQGNQMRSGTKTLWVQGVPEVPGVLRQIFAFQKGKAVEYKTSAPYRVGSWVGNPFHGARGKQKWTFSISALVRVELKESPLASSYLGLQSLNFYCLDDLKILIFSKQVILKCTESIVLTGN